MSNNFSERHYNYRMDESPDDGIWLTRYIQERYKGPLQWAELVDLICSIGRCRNENTFINPGECILGIIFLPLGIYMAYEEINDYYRNKERKRLIPELNMMEFNLVLDYGHLI
jgi:hypothetical protein